MLSYRKLIKESWALVKNNRYLWFFGIFASLTGIFGEAQIISHASKINGGDLFNSKFFFIYKLFNLDFYRSLEISKFFSSSTFIIIASIFLISFLILALITLLSISSQAALVEHGAILILSKNKNLDLNISDGLSQGQKYFWPLLALNLGSSLAISLSFVLISIPLIFTLLSNSIFIPIFYILLFLIFIPIALSIVLIARFAIVILITEGLNLSESIKKAFTVFSKHWLISLEMGILLFFINFLASALLILFLSIFLVPLFFSAWLFSSLFVYLLTYVVILILIITCSALLFSFQSLSWTNLYLKIRANKASAKLERLAKNIKV